MKELKYILGDTDEKIVKFVAVGDVMFARDIKTKVLEKDVDYFFSDCGDIFKNADITFCNLETPITDYDIPSKYSRSNFKIHPHLVDDIAKYFSVVSLANNHIYDYCSKGAEETVRYLEEARIKTTGVGKTIRDANCPAIITVNDIRTGLLSYTCLPTIEEYKSEYAIAVFEEKSVKQNIEELKKVADICIVSLHGGHELINFVEPSFMQKARFAIDCGADLVLGHHPHVIGGIEIYKGKPLVYSLGNFIFDNPTIPERNESIIFQATLDKKIGVASIDIIPIYINNGFVPTIAKGDIYKKIQNRLIALSNYIENGRNNELYWKAASKGFLVNGKENLTSIFSNLGFKGILIMLKRLRLRHFKLFFISLKDKIIKE